MSISIRTARQAAVGAIGAGVVTGALLVGAPPPAQAAPAPAFAPNTAVADVAGATFDVSTVAPADLAGFHNIPARPFHHRHHHWWRHHHHHRHWWRFWDPDDWFFWR